MKKQRGLKVFLSAALAGSQLLAALSVSAEDNQSSTPPAKTAQAAPQTTVQRELQKLVHEDQAGQQSNRPVPAIRQVQATQASASGQQVNPQQVNPQQDLRTARKAVREERRQNGFFRRLFTDNSQPKQIPGLGAPPPKIGNPPPLIYRSVAGQTVQTGGPSGRTMVVSNSAAPGKSTVPIVTSNGKPVTSSAKPVTSSAKPVNGNAKVSTTDGRAFENPFETAADQATDQVDDVLMDLDALVAEEKAALEKAESQVQSAAVAAVPEPAVAAEIEPGLAVVTESADLPHELPAVVSADSEDVAPVTLPVVEPGDSVAAEDVVLTEATPADDEALEAVPLLKVEAADAVVSTEPAAPMALTPVDAATDNVPAEAVVQAPAANAKPQLDVADTAVPQQADVSQQPEQKRSELSVEERRRLLASRARRDHQTYRIMARTGKTGFKGFCPVELRDNRELIDSRQDHKARFGLQTYYFSSEEARVAFEENPSRYAPAAGGSDVVLLVNTSEEEPGSLDFSLWYRDRLFLFRSRETQQLFSKNPARYANQY
ncbi:MAG: hypothetical protein NXI04_08860 [Planctomycetaceae bacterium]|nr:hypothetical protein [Planctomycetaceae bacterium]